jgi:hypothetical protein
MDASTPRSGSQSSRDDAPVPSRCRPHDGFQNAARCAEELAGARAFAEGVVEAGLLGQRAEGDAARADHARQLPGRQNVVDVAGQAGPDGLVLLGGARHHADGVHLLATLREVGPQAARERAALGERAVHLLRRAGRAQVRQQIGAVDFHPVHPRWAA